MCNLMVGVLIVLIYLKSYQTKGTLSVKDRVWVTLAGQNVSFNISLETPGNLSANDLVCYGPRDPMEIQRWEIPPTFTDFTNVYILKFTAWNSSYSGEYFCKFNMDAIYLALLVQDKRYQKPTENGLIVLGVLTTVLLIFSVFGSLYTFRWSKFTVKNKNNGVSRRKRRTEGEEDLKLKTGASALVYESLESRPASVYNVVFPGAENCNSGARKSKTLKNESKILVENVTQGEGLFESVYENF